MSSPRSRMLARPVQNDFSPVRAVDLGDLGPQLALEPLHACPGAVELVLQAQDVLDAGEIQTEPGCEALDQTEALDVRIRVEARPSRRPAGPQEPLRFVHAKRLGMHADEVSRNGDHVARPVGHQRWIPSHPRKRATLYAVTPTASARPTICGHPPSPIASLTTL